MSSHQDNSKVGWSKKYEENFNKIDWSKNKKDKDGK